MKPSIPQGTRDFSADVVRKRNYIFETIRSVFELYGFQPLETPAMENIETLTGKYGEEGDRLIYRILDSGNPFSTDFLAALAQWMSQDPGVYATLEEMGEKSATAGSGDLKNLLESELFRKKLLNKLRQAVSGKALRYDLTIPFARYVAMHHNQLNFPFKRYQIQPVWRADRPQRGRYREFYQCDADIVGSNSLLNETELVQIYRDVFAKLQISVDIKINNRKILAALAELTGDPSRLTDITVSIDKLDKIGLEKVKEELKLKNLGENSITLIEEYLSIRGTNQEKIAKAKELFGKNELAKKGIEELTVLLDYLPEDLTAQQPVIDFTLARGLNYYTGIIFEIKARDVSMGSIGGGGRYDDLTGLFEVPGIPGVGISFGVDRIFDVMEELTIFPEKLQTGTRVLFFNLGPAESRATFPLLQNLRNRAISCELFHETAKFDKQFKYAEKKNIPFAVFIGSKELTDKTCTIKNLNTGEQQTIPQSSITQFDF